MFVCGKGRSERFPCRGQLVQREPAPSQILSKAQNVHRKEPAYLADTEHQRIRSGQIHLQVNRVRHKQFQVKILNFCSLFRAINVLGKTETSAYVQVIHPSNVRDGKPAMFLSRPDKYMRVTEGEDITVSFRVSGDPKPKSK